MKYALGTYRFETDKVMGVGVLVLKMTIGDWPDITPLFIARLRWSDGSGADFHVAGNQIDKNGFKKTAGSVSVNYPQTDAEITGAFAELEVFATFESDFDLVTQ